MKPLSIAVALFGLVALIQPVKDMNAGMAVLGIVTLIAALTTFRSAAISSFLRIFVAIFSVETIVFGLAVVVARAGWWPTYFAEELPPDSLPLTAAIFSILVYVVSRLRTVEQIMRIADRYFDAGDTAGARIWPFPAYRSLERRIAAAMIVFLVVINQAEVAITVRLNFFNRAWFDAIQQRNETVFWEQLLFVFTPYAFLYVGMTVVELFVQQMLVLRWRTWLTDHFVNRWLHGHNHYRISLVAGQTDNPDQRISEDIFRFINGGNDGSNQTFGLYDFSILLISTVTTLVSFSIVLWTLSASFTFPGTNVALPGFLFWVALIYAAAGTLITHLIGRPLIKLYFQRQHMEADYRFSLARLREYSEQVALLDGEAAEKNLLGGSFAALIANYLDVIYRRMRVWAFTQFFRSEYSEQVALLDGEAAEKNLLGGSFAALIANYLDVIYRRMRVWAFTQFFGQISPIIPFIFTAPFYFARKIELGTMTQTAGAFGQVANSLTFFVNYYMYLAGFKSVVDRLNSFDVAIDEAQALAGAGPARVAASSNAIGLDNVDLALPDGRHIVGARHVDLKSGESVALTGPSGSGKSTLFRAISGIWPYGTGRVSEPADRKVMVLPPKPYIPIGTLRSAVTYPAVAGTYRDEDIRAALADAHLGSLAGELDREEVWSQRLSSGEQQRLAIARALLLRPDWLLLDESTSAVEEKLEAELYAVIAQRLPGTTIISIGHRSTLAGLHRRHLELTPDGDRFTLREATPAEAAE